MSRSTDGAFVSSIRRWIARATSSRGASSSTNRSPRWSSSRAPSPRIASVTRNPSAPFAALADRRWVELEHLEVRELGAGRVREQQPRALRAAGFVVRDHSAAAPPVASTTAAAGQLVAAVKAHARRSAVGGQDRGHPAALEHLDPVVLRRERRQFPDQPASGGGAARVARSGAPSDPPRARARGGRVGRRRTLSPSMSDPRPRAAPLCTESGPPTRASFRGRRRLCPGSGARLCLPRRAPRPGPPWAQ